MEEISLRAYGKINLGIDIIGKRADGYHEVEMIMQTVSLYDTIRLVKTYSNKIRVFTDNIDVPENESNIAYKAAVLLMDEFKINTGVDIHIKKKIPMAAGMGGGSADAAATLRGLNFLFELNLTNDELEKRALKLGADVPFLIEGGSVFATGIGERLERLKPKLDCVFLIVRPNIIVETGSIYKEFDKLEADLKRPNIKKIRELILDGASYLEVTGLMGNVLEYVTTRKHKEIEEIKRTLIKLGARFSLMTGSGAAIFGIFENEKIAGVAKEKIRKELNIDLPVVEIARGILADEIREEGYV